MSEIQKYYCAKCRTEVKETDSYCPKCNAFLATTDSVIKKEGKPKPLKCSCGNKIDKDTVICMKCGRQLNKLAVDIADNPWCVIGFKQYWGIILFTLILFFFFGLILNLFLSS